MSTWEMYKKYFNAWEGASAKVLEAWMKSPLVLGPAGAWLTASMKAKSRADEMAATWWGSIGLPTKRDQERTLHKLNQLESRLLDHGREARGALSHARRVPLRRDQTRAPGGVRRSRRASLAPAFLRTDGGRGLACGDLRSVRVANRAAGRIPVRLGIRTGRARSRVRAQSRGVDERCPRHPDGRRSAGAHLSRIHCGTSRVRARPFRRTRGVRGHARTSRPPSRTLEHAFVDRAGGAPGRVSGRGRCALAVAPARGQRSELFRNRVPHHPPRARSRVGCRGPEGSTGRRQRAPGQRLPRCARSHALHERDHRQSQGRSPQPPERRRERAGLAAFERTAAR